jgi:hypothetical protein
MPEPTPSSTEETDAQRKRRREIEYHKDIKFRDLDIPEPPTPERPSIVADIEEWAAKNLPEFKHFVREVRGTIMWTLNPKGENERFNYFSLEVRAKPGKEFPKNLVLSNLVYTRNKTRDFSTLIAMVKKPLNLSRLKATIESIFSGPPGGTDGKN